MMRIIKCPLCDLDKRTSRWAFGSMLGGGGAPPGGSESLALAVSLYATTLGTAAIGTIGRPISHRDSTICFPFPTTLLSPRVLLFG